MGAVAAAVRMDGWPMTNELPQRMIETMSARSPDGTGTWCAERVGLAHGALHTTSVADREPLPLVIDGGRLALTADVRLDNRPELLRELRLEADVGDGRVLLTAYERWGEECPERLLGDFAFAIWDAHREVLFCACDRFAVRPLYWHRGAQVAALGTEIKALLALDEVPRRLNEERLADFLCLQIKDPVSTIYRDISRLPPAHALTFNRTGVRTRRYWQLDPRRAWVGASDAEYEEAFRSTFEAAVGSRLRGPRPVATMLSGGMDSSAVTVCGRERLRDEREQLHTLSAIFDAVPGADEREYIRAVVNMGGVLPHYVRPEQLGPLDDWPGAAWRGDEPEPNPQVSITRALLGAAAQVGVRCVLDGFGGDFVVSFGVERLTELARAGRWRTLWREAEALASRVGGISTSQLLRTHAIKPFLPPRLLLARERRLDLRAGPPRWAGGMPIKPEFAQRQQLRARYEQLSGDDTACRSTRGAQHSALTSALVPLALSILDRIGGGLGVEPRYPFLDSRLVELCLAIPADQKLRDGYNRDILRRGLADLFPPEVRWRPWKAAPGSYTSHSLATLNRPLMDEILCSRPGPVANYVDIVSVREQYRRCLAADADANAWFPIFRVLVAALWLDDAQSRHRLVL